jgi:hypothetical protein
MTSDGDGELGLTGAEGQTATLCDVDDGMMHGGWSERRRVDGTTPLHERAASVAEATVAIGSCVECHRNVIFYVIYIQKITKSTLPPSVPTISLNDCLAPLPHRPDVLCVVTNLNFLPLLHHVLP